MATGRNRPKLPPPVHGFTTLGRFEYFFDAADVNSLSEDVGLKLAPGVNPTEAAYRLWDAYQFAAFHGAYPEGYPAPPDVRREYHEGVLAAAKVLWKRLGIPDDIAAHNNADFMVREAEPWFANLVNPTIYKQEGGANWQKLRAAPEAIALIAGMAEHNLKLLRDMPEARGRTTDSFKPALYFRLANEYCHAFGHAPETGRERVQLNCASSIWINKITNLAAQRIPARILLNIDDPIDRADQANSHPLVIDAKRIACQAFVTKANALATGWKEFAARGNSIETELRQIYGILRPPSA